MHWRVYHNIYKYSQIKWNGFEERRFLPLILTWHSNVSKCTNYFITIISILDDCYCVLLSTASFIKSISIWLRIPTQFLFSKFIDFLQPITELCDMRGVQKICIHFKSRKKKEKHLVNSLAYKAIYLLK